LCLLSLRSRVAERIETEQSFGRLSNTTVSTTSAPVAPPESGLSKGVKVVLSILLMAIGVGLIVVGAYLWLSIDASHPSNKVHVRSVTTTRKPPANKKKVPTTTKVVVTKTTTTTPAVESQRSRRSETLTGTLLVLGTLILLIGAFYGRISEFTLPLGAGAKLFPVPVTPPPKTQAQIAQVIGASEELTAQPQKAEVAYLAALSVLQSEMTAKAQTAAAQGQTPNVSDLAPPASTVAKVTEDAIQKVL
jgi:hypothetical protein